MKPDLAGKPAFMDIYENNVKDVYKTALYYSNSHPAAEEITQNVFITLYLNRESINENKVRPWLLVTAKHMSLNFNRDRKKEVLTEDIIYYGNKDVGVEEGLLSRVNQDEFHKLAEKIMLDLSSNHPRWYQAITICYYLEKPQKEAAQVMGVSVDVLHSMLYRAKKWIKKKYEKEFRALL